jgi:hypothetical protein
MMSTRLENAQKDYEAGVITHEHHQRIVLEERNKEIVGLQARLREADARIRDLTHELEVCRAVTTLCCKR